MGAEIPVLFRVWFPDTKVQEFRGLMEELDNEHLAGGSVRFRVTGIIAPWKEGIDGNPDRRSGGGSIIPAAAFPALMDAAYRQSPVYRGLASGPSYSGDRSARSRRRARAKARKRAEASTQVHGHRRG